MFLLLLVQAVDAKEQKNPLFVLKENDDRIVSEYLKIHKHFSDKLCPSGTEEQFWNKYRAFMESGYYVPSLLDGGLDGQRIVQFIPLVEGKVKWIEGRINDLEKIKNFQSILRDIDGLNADMDELLEYKKNYEEEGRGRKRLLAQMKSERKLIQFTYKVKNFIESISFLHNYNFPVDHMALRRNYDRFKDKKDEQSKKKANEIYFYRRIVQDGTHNNQGKKGDRFLRAVLDTVYINIDRERYFLSENLRYDLRDLLDDVKKYLHTHKQAGIKKRLSSWKKRIEGQRDFYHSLIRENAHEKGQTLLGKKSQKREELKTFVIDKLAETYLFWIDRPAHLTALYVLETILFNEVGRIDALERKDVAQVVLNRLALKKYNELGEDDSLYKKLQSLAPSGTWSNPWVNVMFKEGEFSFTYFFISGNLRIYCPDMSPSGRRLREENIRIALEQIRKPRPSFKAVRYFSRASMLGRVSMDELWEEENFSPLPERRGSEVKNKKHLLQSYQKGNYRYLYSFRDPKGKIFRVIAIGKKVFVVGQGEEKFYKYRNPHFFKYFVEN